MSATELVWAAMCPVAKYLVFSRYDTYTIPETSEGQKDLHDVIAEKIVHGVEYVSKRKIIHKFKTHILHVFREGASAELAVHTRDRVVCISGRPDAVVVFEGPGGFAVLIVEVTQRRYFPELRKKVEFYMVASYARTLSKTYSLLVTADTVELIPLKLDTANNLVKFVKEVPDIEAAVEQVTKALEKGAHRWKCTNCDLRPYCPLASTPL